MGEPPNPPVTSTLTRAKVIHEDIREEDGLITQMIITHVVIITTTEIVTEIIPTIATRDHTTMIAFKMAETIAIEEVVIIMTIE